MPTGVAGPMPPLKRLQELFTFDPVTGILRRIKRAPKAPAGSIVGTAHSTGRLVCHVDYQMVYVHRIAWYLHYKRAPPKIIDHINGVGSDNRIANMRRATVQQNRRNSIGSRYARSALKGAHWSSSERKWRSSIGVDGKHIHLGWFRTKEAAAVAYRAAELRYYGEFARAA